MKQNLFITGIPLSLPPEYQRVQSVVEVLRCIIKEQGVQSIFLVRGGESYMSSGAKDIMDLVYRTNEILIEEFYDFVRNPKIEDVLRGVKLIEAINPDLIVAIGGGSTLDIAKLIRHASTHPNVPLVAIPTTAGTGAESTSFAVCYENGIKKSIDFVDMLPNYVILCPELTLNNNPYLSACTGFDALAQAIESYWNINATDESDAYALEAIKRIYERLPHLQEDIGWRSELVIGANLAGRAINITRTTAPHALSYTLTSKYGYPHGHAVALTFPYFFAKNIYCNRDSYAGKDYESYSTKMMLLLNQVGLNRDDDLFYKMRTYTCQLGLGYDFKRPFDSMEIEKGINLQRAKNNPCQLNSRIIHDAIASII